MKRLLLWGLLAAAPVQAHVALEPASAPAASYAKVRFAVGHGCAGSATVRIAVSIPPEVLSARPAPKPGWRLDTRSEALASPIQIYGQTITERVAEIAWAGGPLPDSQFDEFMILMHLPERPQVLRFKVAQECERGRNEWVETPVPGKPSRFPAPVLQVVPAASAGHRH